MWKGRWMANWRGRWRGCGGGSREVEGGGGAKPLQINVEIERI